MYHLYGFNSQNTMKTLYVLEELGTEYNFTFMNLFKGDNKQEDFLKLNPMGKVPVLQINDDSLFESGAICRYVANQAQSPLYPEDKLQRAKVDQWMDYFTCHLGRWLNVLYFENFIKEKANMGQPDPENCAEADKFSLQQMAIIDSHLTDNDYLAGDHMTIADICAFAYIEQVKFFDFSWQDFPHVKAWFDKLAQRDNVKRAREKFNR